eukprot:73357-Prorocentrum_minimum.AAC.4
MLPSGPPAMPASTTFGSNTNVFSPSSLRTGPTACTSSRCLKYSYALKQNVFRIVKERSGGPTPR